MYQKTNSHSFNYLLYYWDVQKKEVSVKPPDVNESYEIYEEGLNAMKRNEFFCCPKIFRS